MGPAKSYCVNGFAGGAFYDSSKQLSAGASYRHYFGQRGWAIEPEYSLMTERGHQDHMLVLNAVKDLTLPSRKAVLYMLMGAGVYEAPILLGREAVTAGPCWTGLWELCCFRLVTMWVTSLGLAGEAGIFASLPFYPMFSGVPNGPLRLSPPQVHAAVHNSGVTKPHRRNPGSNPQVTHLIQCPCWGTLKKGLFALLVALRTYIVRWLWLAHKLFLEGENWRA